MGEWEWHDDIKCPHCDKPLDGMAEIHISHQYTEFSNIEGRFKVPVKLLISTMAKFRDAVMERLGGPSAPLAGQPDAAASPSSEPDFGASQSPGPYQPPPANTPPSGKRIRIEGTVETQLEENKGYLNFKIKGQDDGRSYTPQGIQGEEAQKAWRTLKVGDHIVVEGVLEPHGNYLNIRKAEIKVPQL